jgi:transposase-like protein
VQEFRPEFCQPSSPPTATTGDKWYLDEVFIRIQGTQHYRWRAVDQHGIVLEILVQQRRDAKAAKPFFRRLQGLDYVPQVLVTDKLRSYGVAKRTCFPTSSTDKADISTIVPRIHIDRRGAENGKCSGSNRQGRPRTSSPLTHSSMATSIHAAI